MDLPAKQQRQPVFIKDLIAGYASGVANVLAGQPFDICKVRIQSSGQGSFLPTLTGIIKNEGAKSLWKGSLFPLLGFGACSSILFAVNENLKYLQKIAADRNYNTLRDFYIAGGMAGIANSVLSSPIEHIRIRMQVQKDTVNRLYNGSIDCARKIFRDHGLSGIYKGLTITIIREFFLYASYFAAYEQLKKQKQEPGKMWLLFSGGMAGLAGWCSAFVLDNVKSRIQVDDFKNPKYSSLRQIPKQLGVKDVTRGFVPGFVRGFPVNSVSFMAFELCAALLYNEPFQSISQ